MYYELLIRYHVEHNAYLEVCRCYRAIYETPSVAEDPARWQPVLKKICWYVVLASASSDQITLLTLTAADKKLEQLPMHKELLAAFTTQEVGLRFPGLFHCRVSGSCACLIKNTRFLWMLICVISSTSNNHQAVQRAYHVFCTIKEKVQVCMKPYMFISIKQRPLSQLTGCVVGQAGKVWTDVFFFLGFSIPLLHSLACIAICAVHVLQGG
jgi:hypothetical protein